MRRAAVAIVVGALLAAGCSAGSSEDGRSAPNFVVIYTDDLDATVTPMRDALPQTMALLADEGLTFTNSFVSDPHCCPARASTLTGRYAHNTGVFDGTPPDGGWSVFAEEAENDTVATRLSDHGYSTGFLGKYVNGYTSTSFVPPGWDEWFALADTSIYDGYGYTINDNGEVRRYGTTESDYQTDVLEAQAVAYLDDTEQTDTQPFFLFVSPTAPHWPLRPAPRHDPNPFATVPLPTTDNFNEADVSDKPTWLREGRPLLDPVQAGLLAVDHRNRLGSLLAVDELVASIVSTLESNGELDDTVIIFTSDNGYNLGSHRLGSKLAPYDESLRVPLVMRGPGITTGTRSAMAVNIDLTPTILDLAGLDATDLDGRSLAPLLDGADPTWRDDFLIEFHNTARQGKAFHTLAQVERAISRGNEVTVPTYQGLRTSDWLYVQWYSGPDHEYELYDLQTDPYQLENLLATPQGAETNAAVVAELQQRLDQLAACAGPSCRD